MNYSDTATEYELIPLDQIKDGLPVNYHPFIGRINDDEDICTRVVRVPWKLGHGDLIVKVEGIAGGVAVEALSIRLTSLTGGKQWRPYRGESCEDCGDRVEVLTRSTEANWYYDGDEAKCVSCYKRGDVSIDGRESYIEWYEDEDRKP